MDGPFTAPLPKRNAACACGSGKKYKHCCGRASRAGSAAGTASSAHQWYDLANQRLAASDVNGAVSYYRRAVAAKPDFYQAHGNLGVLLEERGLLPESLDAYHAASVHGAHSTDAPATRNNYLTAVAHWQNRLFSLHRGGAADLSALATEHRRFARLIERHWGSDIVPHANYPDSDRRLRVGYVSADFREHSVAHFIEPILACHDREAIELCCYFNGPPNDPVTKRFRSMSTVWRDCARWTDEELVRCIREDAIDVLVDLAGHTKGNRFIVFASRPAPVQVAYLGYPGSTELETMDCRLTDALCEPAGEPAARKEEARFLSPCMVTYRPPYGANGLLGNADAPVTHAPCLLNNQVTFGCFNDLSKIGAAVVSTWSRLLLAVPGARLLLKAKSLDAADSQAEWRARFERHGVHPDRLMFLGRDRTVADHLRRYADIDLALDTFPYSGVTTTCEALWMGIPVISLAGSSVGGRMGLSILSAFGEPNWVAGSTEEYVRIAAALAADPIDIERRRQSGRDRFERSPLADAAALARQIEGAYRDAWRHWCAGQLSGSQIPRASRRTPH